MAGFGLMGPPMARGVDAIDKLVGKNIRNFRLAKKLSQTELGNSIGVTFQQIQKYENGTNRVGSGRLAKVAQALNVPITRMFNNDVEGKDGDLRGEVVTDLLSEPCAIQMLKAFSSISDLKVRRRLVSLVESLGGKR